MSLDGRPGLIEAAAEAEVESTATETECSEYSEAATIADVHVFVLLDQSGSMGDGDNGRREQKWDPVSAALSTFFADPASRGLHASLTLFPPDINVGAGPADHLMSDPSSCDPESYETPLVPVRALPDAEGFREAIDSVSPPNEWGTPTQPALEGVIVQVEKLLASDPDARAVVVLVTDGEPAQCTGNNSVQGTADLARSFAAAAPTYVVGVGSSLQNLHRVAEAGGTGEALVIPIRDPAATKQTLLDTLAGIREQVVSCDVPVPPQPAGQVFDKRNVAVEMTFGQDPAQLLDYNPNCAGGSGWRYDSADTPARIQLCRGTCDSARTRNPARLGIVFACHPLIMIPR